MIGNRNKNHYDLLVPENILFPKRRRELRTQFVSIRRIKTVYREIQYSVLT